MTVGPSLTNSHQNNFDVLRAVSAGTVLLMHLHLHYFVPTGQAAEFGTLSEIVRNWYRFFPGVPVFFIISGYLITGSWLKNPNLFRYLKARALRIYPAYVFAAWFCVMLLCAAGYKATPWWLLQQLSVFGYNNTPPDLLGFAGEAPNGSLWTIPVELSFYILLPALLLGPKAWRGPAIALLGIASAAVNYASFGDNAAGSTLSATFCYFALGILAQLYWPMVRGFIVGRFGWWLLAHAAVFLLLPHSHLLPAASIPLALALTLAPMVLAAAYTAPSVGKQLRGIDLSYGLYLFHLPLIHLWRHMEWGHWPLLVAACVAIATASWFLVEKPALRLK